MLFARLASLFGFAQVEARRTILPPPPRVAVVVPNAGVALPLLDFESEEAFAEPACEPLDLASANDADDDWDADTLHATTWGPGRPAGATS